MPKLERFGENYMDFLILGKVNVNLPGPLFSTMWGRGHVTGIYHVTKDSIGEA